MITAEQNAGDWERGSLHVNGVELAYELSGPPSGEPLVLVMGLAWQLIHWPDGFCSELVRRGFRVLRFDNRDVGLSGSADRGVRFDFIKDSVRAKFGATIRANYTLHDLADDTCALMDALAMPRAHLVGVSMGGMISQLIAGRSPERVKSLTSIMSSTNHPWLPPPRLPVLKAMLSPLPQPITREAVVARMTHMANLLAGPAYRSEPAHVAELCDRAYSRAFRPAGVVRQTHGILATGSLERFIKRIRAPTHVVHGLADPLVRPIGGKRSAKLIHGAELTLVEGWGHDLPLALMPRFAQIAVRTAGRA